MPPVGAVVGGLGSGFGSVSGCSGDLSALVSGLGSGWLVIIGEEATGLEVCPII